MSNKQNKNKPIGECKLCGRPATRKHCGTCRKQFTTPRQRHGPPAQMSHASSGRARKKAHELAARATI